jgi:hypothetical protein
MQIHLISDIHVERGFDFRLIKNSGSDVLVLAGDVGVGSVQTSKVLKHFASVFPHVIYVFGNHEFYSSDMIHVKSDLKELVHDLSNVHILDADSVEINNVVFIGATLWSNFNNCDPVVMWESERGINDFRLIRKNRLKFTALEASREFTRDSTFIKNEVTANQNKTCIVVTHFLPSLSCIDPQYKDSGNLNYYFASELGNEIAMMSNVPYWMFGHTHSKIDINIGNTKCIANPYGYHNLERSVTDSKHPILNFTVKI